ncbi:MAG: DNA replication/repair protein RecF [Candidatus Methylacidiphilales bacterium]
MLTRLTIRNLRCYQEFTFSITARATAFLGPNGRGKTTLLEALYLLGRLRSFRSATVRDLVRTGEKGLAVEGTFEHEAHTVLRVVWEYGARRLEIDGNDRATLGEFWGRFPVVVFRNEDRALAAGPDSLRRRWADALLASTQPTYLALAQRAHQLLRQRATLLRGERPDRGLWEALVTQLDPLTAQMSEARSTFASTVASPRVAEVYAALTGRAEALSLIYQADWVSTQSLSLDGLWEREVRSRAVIRGPHRDGWELRLDGQPLRTHGSEGQQKGAALALRLVEADTLRVPGSPRPTLLFDDVWNDLDGERRERFWGAVPTDCPWFLATTEKAHLPSVVGLHDWVLPERNELR